MLHSFYRRALVPVVILALVWGACLTGAAAGPGGFDYGDINADGDINAADALLALQYSVQLRELTDEEFKRADVNISQTTDASDALLILQYSVGLITKFDAEKQNQAKEGLYGMTYRYEDGKYIQEREAIEMEGPRTTLSIDRMYAPSMHVNVDRAGVSIGVADTWKKAGYTVTTGGGAFNHADGTYESLHPEDLQVDANGNTGAAWDSLVLTPRAIEYILQNNVIPALEYGSKNISFSEPEMFRQGLYGDGYKQLWKNTYGTEWINPLSSPEAVFLSQRLNISTHVNAIRSWAGYIKSNTSDVTFGIETHSTMAYANFTQGITNGYHHMMATGLVDEVLGQTWSNTMENTYLYQGNNTRYPFLHGFLGYGSFLDAAIQYNADFYALNDAMSDTANGQNESYWRGLNHDQLVASSLYGEIDRWNFIWTNRSFMYVSPEYRAEQMNIYNAMNDISGKEFKLTAGTPGITYLLADTLSWQVEGENWCQDSYESFYGITAPLVQDGIPVRTKAMEFVTTPQDLEGVTLLIVSYDNMKPLSEEVNIAIADWVKAGGTLLYTGGPDSYVEMESEWWNEEGKGGSPLQNLIGHLGLNATVTPYDHGISYLEWKAGTADEKFDSEQLVGMDSFDYAIDGDGFDKVITNAYDDAIAIESKVGQGHVILSGLSSHHYAESEGGANLMRILTEYALCYTDYTYVTSDYMKAERGDYTAIHSLTGDTVLEGDYIDIFSDTLAVVHDPVVAEGESRLFYRLPTDDTNPLLGYTGGIQDFLTETANTTTLTYHGAENALVASRFIAPEGLTPVKVSATDSNGHTISPATMWDAETATLLVQTFTTPTNPTTITVEWGNGTPVCAAQYEYFELAVNNSDADKDYIVSNTAAAKEGYRYTDGDAELVYRFDLSDYQSSLFALNLCANYLIEVSSNGEDWITAIDFSAESSERATVLNTAVRAVDPNDFGIQDTLYIRMRNTDPKGGWGGQLRKITVQYLPRA